MGSLKLGKMFNIGIYVHWTWFLLPVIALFFTGNEVNGNEVNPFFYLLLLVSVFGCVILHELGHALTARNFGIDTRDITLYPIGGVARLERMSDKPWEEFWIAVGGPAVNVAIAGLLFVAMLPVAVYAGGLDFFQATLVGQFFGALMMVNVMLVIFNMLPAFPMDGGRVFRSLLSMWLGQLQATRIAATVGVFMAILIGVFGLFVLQQPILAAIALFVLFAGQQELRMVEYRHRYPGWGDDDAVPVVPVGGAYTYPREPVEMEQTGPDTYEPAERPRAAQNGMLYPPKIMVYTWDSEAGVWVQEPSRPRFTE